MKIAAKTDMLIIGLAKYISAGIHSELRWISLRYNSFLKDLLTSICKSEASTLGLSGDWRSLALYSFNVWPYFLIFIEPSLGGWKVIILLLININIQ